MPTYQTMTDLLARDTELTAFKHYALEHRNETMKKIIEDFPFDLIDAVKHRASLIEVGYDARRYPHRIPPIK